jgi:hypothetical protein
MKSLMQIAIECDMMYNEISRCIKSIKIIPTKVKRINNYALYLDKYQEDLLHQHLYFIGKIQEITLQSKMNYL